MSDLKKVLDENIPALCVSTRQGGSGKPLDYLEGWYVIDRMNQVFGHLNWDRETVEMLLIPGDKPIYRAKVRVTVRINGGWCLKEGYGFGSAKGRGEARPEDHEIAFKEAETDAFKRAAMQFGRSLGLALYDKTQRYVDDEVVVNQEQKTSEVEPVRPIVQPAQATTKATPPKDEKTLKEFIRNSLRVLITKEQVKALEFKEKYLSQYGTDTLEPLNQKQCMEILARMASDFKSLNIEL